MLYLTKAACSDSGWVVGVGATKVIQTAVCVTKSRRMGAVELHLNVNRASESGNKGIPVKPALIQELQLASTTALCMSPGCSGSTKTVTSCAISLQRRALKRQAVYKSLNSNDPSSSTCMNRSDNAVLLRSKPLT